jgi:large subunit ribosomal protein L6
MSRVGKQPIVVPDGVDVTIQGSSVGVKGPKGELSGRFDADMSIELAEGQITVTRPTDQARHRALHGLTRSLVANMVHGVHEGFERSLEIHGVGYRAIQKGSAVEFSVGYSNPVLFEPPSGVELVAETQTLVHVRGIDKQSVGEVAAQIRRIRPPEPYKGKGIRYRATAVSTCDARPVRPRP